MVFYYWAHIMNELVKILKQQVIPNVKNYSAILCITNRVTVCWIIQPFPYCAAFSNIDFFAK